MIHEADFCGDRLRLTAFLRVLAAGMPHRPTRFKRRYVGSDHGSESSILNGPDLSHLENDRALDLACEQGPDETPIAEVILSSAPQPPTLAAVDHRLAKQANDVFLRDRSRSNVIQPTEGQRQTNERLSTTASMRPVKQPRQISSTRKRQQIPKNELTLLRTTSLDGLSLPSVRRCSAMKVWLTCTDTQL